jgi:hypothetical protein
MVERNSNYSFIRVGIATPDIHCHRVKKVFIAQMYIYSHSNIVTYLSQGNIQQLYEKQQQPLVFRVERSRTNCTDRIKCFLCRSGNNSGGKIFAQNQLNMDSTVGDNEQQSGPGIRFGVDPSANAYSGEVGYDVGQLEYDTEIGVDNEIDDEAVDQGRMAASHPSTMQRQMVCFKKVFMFLSL